MTEYVTGVLRKCWQIVLFVPFLPSKFLALFLPSVSSLFQHSVYVYALCFQRVLVQFFFLFFPLLRTVVKES